MEKNGGMILTGEEPRNSEKNLSQCNFAYQKSHTD
jgi:hypothetical protein